MTEPLTSDERAGLRAWAVADRDTTPWPVTAIGTKILRLLDDLERVESERDAHMANRCRHGWRGATAEQITTPCPACGKRGLFIGAGGHLTCGNLGEGGNRGEPYSGCRDPSVEEFVVRLKADLERVERERDEARAELKREKAWPRCENCAAELVDGGYPEGKTCPVCDLRDRLRDAKRELAQKAQEMTRLYDEINRRERAEARLAMVVGALERIVVEERGRILTGGLGMSQSLHFATAALAAAKGER